MDIPDHIEAVDIVDGTYVAEVASVASGFVCTRRDGFSEDTEPVSIVRVHLHDKSGCQGDAVLVYSMTDTAILHAALTAILREEAERLGHGGT